MYKTHVKWSLVKLLIILGLNTTCISIFKQCELLFRHTKGILHHLESYRVPRTIIYSIHACIHLLHIWILQHKINSNHFSFLINSWNSVAYTWPFYSFLIEVINKRSSELLHTFLYHIPDKLLLKLSAPIKL